MRLLAAISISLIFFCGNVFAADPPKVAIAVQHSSAQDPTGERFVYHLKQGIRKSQNMTLVNSTKDAVIVISIVSISDDAKRLSSLSIAWLLKNQNEKAVLDFFLDQTIQTCGTNVVAQCAESNLATTDRHATDWAWIAKR